MENIQNAPAAPHPPLYLDTVIVLWKEGEASLKCHFLLFWLRLRIRTTEVLVQLCHIVLSSWEKSCPTLTLLLSLGCFEDQIKQWFVALEKPFCKVV